MMPLPARLGIDEFAGQRCFFRKRNHLVITQEGSVVCRQGDRVRADPVDPSFRRVEFALMGR